MTVKELKDQLKNYKDEDVIADASIHVLKGAVPTVYLKLENHINGFTNPFPIAITLNETK
jgi:hypothetical protein